MLKLDKGAPPDVLLRNADLWTRELLEHLTHASGKFPDNCSSRYGHQDIRSAVDVETRKKCAYCESLYQSTSWGGVEHIIPKSKKPELTYQWANLTLSCEKCNTAKSNYHEESAPLINPYEDTPSRHVYFQGPILLPMPGDGKGRRTEKRLKLNRGDLVSARIERLRDVERMIDAWHGQEPGPDKDLYWGEILQAMQPEAPFSAMVKDVVDKALEKISSQGAP